MLDHVNIRVANYDRSKKFYEAALAPLGYTLAMENASGGGFRKDSIQTVTTLRRSATKLSERGREID